MSQQREAFLEEWLPIQHATGRDMHRGEVSTWLDTWSHHEPVSNFGAGVRGRTGWPEVERTIRAVAARFAQCLDYEYELVLADVHGDLAYTCGFERYTALRPSGERFTNELRVTQVYRREDGVWKLVHRHGDNPPVDSY